MRSTGCTAPIRSSSSIPPMTRTGRCRAITTRSSRAGTRCRRRCATCSSAPSPRACVDPGARVLETQWRTALNKVAGAVHQCAIVRLRACRRAARQEGDGAPRMPGLPPADDAALLPAARREERAARRRRHDRRRHGPGRGPSDPAGAGRPAQPHPGAVAGAGARRGATHEVPPGKTVRLMDGVEDRFRRRQRRSSRLRREMA